MIVRIVACADFQMNARRSSIFVIATAMTICRFASATADPQTSPKMIRIENGENHVDFAGDGTPGLVVSGHRENYNAHSFDVVSFYVQSDAGTGAGKQWLIVPITNSKSKQWDEKFEVTIGGGADCLLHDFRLLARDDDKPATLLIAERTTGDFVEREPITFSYYTLVHNTDRNFGSIPYVFDLSRVTTSKANYCDVDEAMKTELGPGKP